MARRSYVVSYDIADDKRRTAVFKTLMGHGDRVQFSVFICELSDRELSELRVALRMHINAREDQVMIIDLGPSGGLSEGSIQTIGVGYEPSIRTIVV